MAPSQHRPHVPCAVGLGAVGQAAGWGDSEQHRQHPTGQGERWKPWAGGTGWGGQRRREGRGGLVAVTAAAPSGWRSPPRPPPSARTQTGPGGAGEGVSLGAAPPPQGNQGGFWGTLVCTMPGRWSRMCSSVAAMSISFTPGGEAGGGGGGVRAEPPSTPSPPVAPPYLWPCGSGPCPPGCRSRSCPRRHCKRQVLVTGWAAPGGCPPPPQPPQPRPHPRGTCSAR